MFDVVQVLEQPGRTARIQIDAIQPIRDPAWVPSPSHAGRRRSRQGRSHAASPESLVATSGLISPPSASGAAGAVVRLMYLSVVVGLVPFKRAALSSVAFTLALRFTS